MADFPNRYSGLSQGLTQGLSMGFQAGALQDQRRMQEMTMQAQQAEAQRKSKADELDNALKLADSLTKQLETAKKMGGSAKYKASIAAQLDEVRQKTYGLMGMKTPKNDGNWDDADFDLMAEWGKLMQGVAEDKVDPAQFASLMQDWNERAVAPGKDKLTKVESLLPKNEFPQQFGAIMGRVGELEPAERKATTDTMSGQLYSQLVAGSPPGYQRKNFEQGLSMLDRTAYENAMKLTNERAAGSVLGEMSNIKSPEMKQDAMNYVRTLAPELAQKIEAAERSSEYKTQEPKHRGKDSGQPYVWNPNAVNAKTGGKGDYVRLDGKPLSQTGESLIPLEVKTTPTPVIKEANFIKSAKQRLENMAKYYKPEYVGIIQGRIANPERKLATLPPEQVKFYREFKQFNDDIIRAKEGAVIPDAMMARLEQFLNDIKQPSGNFESQFESIVDYTRDQGKNLDESLEGQYISPFKKEHRQFWEDRKPLLRRMSPNSGGKKSLGEIFKR